MHPENKHGRHHRPARPVTVSELLKREHGREQETAAPADATPDTELKPPRIARETIDQAGHKVATSRRRRTFLPKAFSHRRLAALLVRTPVDDPLLAVSVRMTRIVVLALGTFVLSAAV